MGSVDKIVNYERTLDIYSFYKFKSEKRILSFKMNKSKEITLKKKAFLKKNAKNT